MPTGYEVKMYQDLSTIASAAKDLPRAFSALERIADALEALSRPVVVGPPVVAPASDALPPDADTGP